MYNHGINVYEQSTSTSTPVSVDIGVPFVIGAAPIQSAESARKSGMPVICTNWNEAVEQLGYSEDWENYNLCEFMYSHFKLFGCSPVIFCNMLDIETMKATVAATDTLVTDHKIKLPIEAIDDATLVVKPIGGTGEAYVSDVDYSTYYDGENLVIELLQSGSIYAGTSLNVAYSKVTPEAVTATIVAAGIENIEKCLTTVGKVPDLIVSPKYSKSKTVAAVMAAKAESINGIFKAKALIDLSTAESDGATTYPEAISLKATNNFVDKNQIVCWPLLKLDDKTFNMSTQLAGLIAKVDSSNGCPYESPSNKALKCDSMVLEDGSEVILTLAQANMLNSAGIVTALNFLSGWVLWGSYTACYPNNTDVKDYFIPVSRMFDWESNTLIRTFWAKLDKPMVRRLVDSIVDTENIRLNGLVGAGYLLGGRVEFNEAENPDTNLMAAIIKAHVYMTPPSPAQRFDFVLEYDADYVASALIG